MSQWTLFNSPLAEGELKFLEPSEGHKYLYLINKGVYGALMLRILYQDSFDSSQYGQLLLNELSNADIYKFLILKHYTETRNIVTTPVHQKFIDEVKFTLLTTSRNLVTRLSTDVLQEYNKRQIRITRSAIRSIPLHCPQKHTRHNNTSSNTNIYAPQSRQTVQTAPLDLRIYRNHSSLSQISGDNQPRPTNTTRHTSYSSYAHYLQRK